MTRLKTHFVRWTGAHWWTKDARDNYRLRLCLDIRQLDQEQHRPIELRLSHGQACQLLDVLTTRLADLQYTDKKD